MAGQPDDRIGRKSGLELGLETWLFRARWLMAPFYILLVASLPVLLFVAVEEAWHEFSHLFDLSAGRVVVVILSLVDLSLVANLLLIVIFSGYETFVSRMEVRNAADRPAWMGSIDFSGLKLRLMASLVAISAVVLMRGFMLIAEGKDLSDRQLGWMVGIHLVFVVSCLVLALMDFVAAKAGH